MRILIHTQYYPPEMGAPQARLSDLARRLKQLGHEIYVLTAMPNYPTGKIFEGYPRYYMKEVQEYVLVFRAWVLPSNQRDMIHRLVSYLSFCISSLFVGLVRIPSVDIIITESPPLFLAFVGWLLAITKRSRWILNVSDLWPDSAKFIGIMRDGSLVYRVLQKLAHFLYRRAWLVTGQSKEIISEIKRQVPMAQVYHLSNGVDIQSFHPQKREGRIRQSYLKEGEIGYIYAGLHGLFQGLDQIISAANHLKGEPARFIFVGDGPEKDALVKKSQDLGLNNVDFYPPIPHGQMPSILASMDVALITLKSVIRGAVPSKIYEAMASGIPILLVMDGEAKDIVRQAHAGITVFPGDLEGMVKAIRELTSQPDWRRRMGESGRLAATKWYDRLRIAEEFEALLHKTERAHG